MLTGPPPKFHGTRDILGREFRPVIGLNLFDMEPQPRQFPIAPRSGAAPTRAQGFAQSISAV